MWFGNVTASDTIQIPWDVQSLSSGSVTPTTAGSIRIYKGSSTTERSSASGITDTRTFDSVTGQNLVVIDLSDNTDAGFYAAGNNYHVMLVGAVVEGLTINKWLASFSIQNRNDYADIREIGGSAVSTSTAQLGVNVVNAGGTAWASGSLTSGVFASGAITATAIAADAIGASELAADAATEIATAVWANATRTVSAATNITSTGGTVPITAGGLVSADVTAISTDTVAADNAESFFDGTGYAGTNNVIPTVTTLTNLPAITAGWLTASGIAADAITAAKLAADVTTELQSGLATAASLSTVDTNVSAIKAKTDSLAFTVAGQVDANIQYVNDVQVTGTGASGDEWGP